MNAELKRFIRQRAGGCCEYCRLRQDYDFLPQHIDHIIARKHGGADDPTNLCLACANCSLAKGPCISGKDTRTGRMARLFNPRRDLWSKHFRWRDAKLAGKTAIGRTTIRVLNINDPDRVALRQSLLAQGLFPA